MGNEILEVGQAGVAIVERPPRKRQITRGHADAGEPQTFYESSRSESPTVLSPAEAEQVRAIRRAAELDPEAFLEACRSGAR